MLQQLHAARYKGLIALLLDPTSTLPSSSTLPSLRILLKADLVIPDLVNGYLLPSDSLASQLGRAYKAKQNAPKSCEFKSSGTLPAVNPEEDLSAIDDAAGEAAVSSSAGFTTVTPPPQRPVTLTRPSSVGVNTANSTLTTSVLLGDAEPSNGAAPGTAAAAAADSKIEFDAARFGHLPTKKRHAMLAHFCNGGALRVLRAIECGLSEGKDIAHLTQMLSGDAGVAGAVTLASLAANFGGEKADGTDFSAASEAEEALNKLRRALELTVPQMLKAAGKLGDHHNDRGGGGGGGGLSRTSSIGGATGVSTSGGGGGGGDRHSSDSMLSNPSRSSSYGGGAAVAGPPPPPSPMPQRRGGEGSSSSNAPEGGGDGGSTAAASQWNTTAVNACGAAGCVP